jgi:hypothetical protein
MRLAYVRIFAF